LLLNDDYTKVDHEHDEQVHDVMQVMDMVETVEVVHHMIE
jgi:hypothetical protein